MELNACETVDEIGTYLTAVYLIAEHIGVFFELPVVLIDDDFAQKLPEYLAACVELLLSVIHVKLFVAHEDPHGISDDLAVTTVTIDGHVALVGVIDDHKVLLLAMFCSIPSKESGLLQVVGMNPNSEVSLLCLVRSLK